MTNGVQSSENPRWGNSRHAHVRHQRPVVVMGLPIVNTIEKLDPECPLKAGDTCRWETFSIGKGYTMAQGHLTGRASYTTASGLEVEVQQDTDGAWKGFKKPAALMFHAQTTIMGSIAEPTQIDPIKREIQGILAASERLCLPAPKVEAVVMCDLTALVKVHEAREELAELAWIAFGELLDACVADYITAIAFITVYGVDLFWFEAVDTNGLTVKATEWRYTFYGPLPLLTEHQSKLAALGTKASQIYRDLKPSEALNTRYQWKHGELIETPRKAA